VITTQARSVLYIIACGGRPVGDLPQLVRYAQDHGWHVCVIATPSGMKFLDPDLLTALTGHPVRVHATIHDATRRYRAGIIADRGPLAEIRRSAANELAGLVADVGGPAVVTVAVDAGLGKTGVLGQVLQALDAPAAEGSAARERPVMLAARLDRLGEFRDAPSLGRALGLPGSPAAVLSRVAAGRPALLVLDQVDAFGAGSGRNPARLEAVAETLREARALSVRVLLACWAFDLEVREKMSGRYGTSR
jgi:hypothetical protein